MNILITGGAGFIGSHLVRKLGSNNRVVVVDSLEPQVHSGADDFTPEIKNKAICINADVRNSEKYLEELANSQVVIHLSSQTGTGQSMFQISRYVCHNTDGTARLLEAIDSLHNKPSRIILASTRAVYGEGAYLSGGAIFYPMERSLSDLSNGIWEIHKDNEELSPVPMREDHHTYPVSVYGFTKLWQEQLIRNFCLYHDLDFAILRFQNAYGPGQAIRNPYSGIIGAFATSMFRNNEIRLYEDGRMTRDFVYVEDIADVIIETVFREGRMRDVINVGTGKSVSLFEFSRLLSEVANLNTRVLVTGEFRKGDIRHAVADTGKFRNIFGGKEMTGLREGLGHYLDWFATQSV